MLASVCVGLLSGTRWSLGQAAPTAIQPFQLEAFGGLSGVYTGLVPYDTQAAQGRNLSITAGADVVIHSYFGVNPGVEVRGTYPVDQGGVAGEESVLAGPVLSKRFQRLQVYGDVLFGRGELKYVTAYPDPLGTTEYQQTTTNVISPGGGVNLRLTQHLGLKADLQFQRFSTPVTTSGTIDSKPLTLAVIWHFGGGLLTHRGR